MFRRIFARVISIAFASICIANPTFAQNQNNSTIKIIIGFPAGGALDNLTRALAERLRVELGKTIVVENKPGAGTHIALMTVKRAAADGATILISPSSPFVVHALTYEKLSYDPDKDLIPVAYLSDTPLAITTSVNNPYSSMREYLDWVKKNPDQSGVGMVSLGGVFHFSLLAVNQQSGLSLTPVAYKGAPAMLADEIGGVLPIGMDTVASADELVKSGKVKYLGVPGKERSKLVPKVPTVLEQGIPGFENATNWYAAFVPAGTPASVVNSLEKAMIKIVRDPEFAAKMAQIGMITTGESGADLATKIQQERKALKPIVDASGFKVTQ